MKKGDIVLVHFPFTDLSGKKLRPAMVLAAHRDDVILAFISSNAQNPDPFDILLKPENANGLKKDSVLKLSKIATLDLSLIAGRLGKIDPQLLQFADNQLKTIFALS